MAKHNWDTGQNKGTVTLFHCTHIIDTQLRTASIWHRIYPLVTIVCSIHGHMTCPKSPRQGPHWMLICDHQDHVPGLFQQQQSAAVGACDSVGVPYHPDLLQIFHAKNNCSWFEGLWWCWCTMAPILSCKCSKQYNSHLKTCNWWFEGLWRC